MPKASSSFNWIFLWTS